MVDAWKQARKAIESRYKGLCDILEKRKVKDEVTKATVLKDIAVLSNQPCRCSLLLKSKLLRDLSLG